MVRYDRSLESHVRAFLTRFESTLAAYARLNPWSEFRWSEGGDHLGRPWVVLTDSEGNGWFSIPTTLIFSVTADTLARDMKATELTGWQRMGSPLTVVAGC